MITFILFTSFGLAIAADWGLFTQDPGQDKAGHHRTIAGAILLAVGYGIWCALV